MRAPVVDIRLFLPDADRDVAWCLYPHQSEREFDWRVEMCAAQWLALC